MATRKRQEILKECDMQCDSLFASFGRLLYENIQSGGISYFFESPPVAGFGDPGLAAQAKRLIRDVVVGKISERKPRLDPFVIARESKVAPVVKSPAKVVQAVVPSSKAARMARPARSAKPKIAVAKVLKEPVAPAGLPLVSERDPLNLGIERRGQLEPYTKLLIDLHVALRKLREIRNDFNDGITVGLLYAAGDRTVACQAAVDEKLRAAVSLMEKKQEAIRLVMENKKQFLAEDKDNTVWKPEADFLKELALDAAESSRRIDGLINEVVDLFRNIKSVYEKELEAGLARTAPARAVPDPAVADAEGTDEVLDQPLDQPLDQEPEEIVSGLLAEEPDETLDEKLDYGLFETGARKLLSEAVDQNEKLSILHTLFRNAPRRVVPYLFELVRDAEMYIRRQLVALLGQLDYPTMVDLYRRFITDESSSLRLAGMMGLVKLSSDEAKHVIVSAVNDRDANIRRFIVNHLDHHGHEPDATALARLARDIDEMVARIAIRKLGLMSNHFAFVTAVPLLESHNIKIRKEIISALFLMTGTDLGYDCGAPESERTRSVRQWKILSKESYTQPRFLRDMRLKHAIAGKAASVVPAPRAARLAGKTAHSRFKRAKKA